MASIHPHGDGFRVHYADATGARRKSPTLPTQAAGEEWARLNAPDHSGTTILAWIDRWVTEEPTPYRRSVGTRMALALAGRPWKEPADISLASLRQWVTATTTRDEEGQVTCESWRQPSIHLRAILRWAHKVHGCHVRPEVLEWSPPRRARSTPAALLTDLQIDGIRDCASTYGPRAFNLIDYLTTYGARPITAARMRRRHLDVAGGELIIEHAKRSGGWRHALLDTHLDAWFPLPWEGADGNAPLFPHYLEDRPWRIETGRANEMVWWYRNTIAKRLKLGPLAGIYHLKRYAITRWFRAGCDPATIALFTGHLSLDQVMKYARSNKDRQREALRGLVPTNGSQVPTESA
jgi:hypothetical protein